jgi:hypothetical protein
MGFEAAINTGVTVDTTGAAAYCMTGSRTGQRTVCHTVNVAVITGTLMNAGDHRTGMTGNTIRGADTGQLRMRLGRMAGTKIGIFCGMTIYTTACGTHRMTGGIAS